MNLRRARRGALLTIAASSAVALAATVPAAAASGPAQVPDNHGSPHAYVAGAELKVGTSSDGIDIGPLFESYLADGESTDEASLLDFDKSDNGVGLLEGKAVASEVQKSDNPRAEAGVTNLRVLPDQTGLSDILNNLIGGLGNEQDQSSLGIGDLGDLGDILNFDQLDLGNVLGGLLDNTDGNDTIPSSLISAKTVDTTCSIKDGKAEPHTTIEDLKVLGQEIPIDSDVHDQSIEISNPLGDGDLLKLTLGETAKNDAGETIVNGIHLQVLNGKNNPLSDLLSGDVIVSHSHCGPAEAPSPAPTPKPEAPANPVSNGQITQTPKGSVNTGGGATANTTEPWLAGLGAALALSGAGAGVVAYRRRRATQS
jgi:hypothetical protein